MGNKEQTLKSLRVSGWDGVDLFELNGMGSKTVELDIENESYQTEQGEQRERLKIKWVNQPGGSVAARPMSDDRKRQFAAEMRGALHKMKLSPSARSSGASPGGASRSPSAARPAQRPNGSQRDPHPNAPGGLADQFDPNDDVPF